MILESSELGEPVLDRWRESLGVRGGDDGGVVDIGDGGEAVDRKQYGRGVSLAFQPSPTLQQWTRRTCQIQLRMPPNLPKIVVSARLRRSRGHVTLSDALRVAACGFCGPPSSHSTQSSLSPMSTCRRRPSLSQCAAMAACDAPHQGGAMYAVFRPEWRSRNVSLKLDLPESRTACPHRDCSPSKYGRLKGEWERLLHGR